MKKITKCLSVALSACMLLSPVTPALASEITAPRIEEQQVITRYASYTGVITQINDHYAIEGGKILAMNSETQGEATFVITPDVLLLDIEEFQVGDELTGFYRTNKPMTMIYPPQYPLDVVVGVTENFVTVDQFDADLISQDKQLKLNHNEGSPTVIVDQEGQPYEGSLTNRDLVVFYTVTTRSIPAQTTPHKIVVLDDVQTPSAPDQEQAEEAEEAETEAAEPAENDAEQSAETNTHPEVITPEAEDSEEALTEDAAEETTEETPEDTAEEANTPEESAPEGNQPADESSIDAAALATYPIVVEQQTIDAPTAWLNTNEAVMVPLRCIAEALGYEVSWRGEDASVLLGEDISFRIGEEGYVKDNERIVLAEGVAELQDGVTYVPLQFFAKVLGVSSANVLDGQIVIDNAE